MSASQAGGDGSGRGRQQAVDDAPQVLGFGVDQALGTAGRVEDAAERHEAAGEQGERGRLGDERPQRGQELHGLRPRRHRALGIPHAVQYGDPGQPGVGKGRAETQVVRAPLGLRPRSLRPQHGQRLGVRGDGQTVRVDDRRLVGEVGEMGSQPARGRRLARPGRRHQDDRRPGVRCGEARRMEHQVGAAGGLDRP
ncbi:hypothetical protein GY12_08695 [Micrococcus luteus]|nr:hypothetical protein GY12_08695 [Micrococcus luteus]